LSGRLEGRVAAITGSSRGIGRAVAEAFVRDGARVVINSRDQGAADRAAGEIGEAAVGVGADVTTESGAAAVVERALGAFGRLDVMVNNAGMAVAADSRDLSLDAWRKAIDLNMTAVFLCAREAARHMLEAGRGVIINTTSVQAFAPFPRRLAYGSTKAAVVMMTRIMAAEWAPAIRVNAVAPGYVRTAMTERLMAEGKIDFEAISRRTPQHRIADPAEIAGAYTFLAGDEASFVTGETIVVDGGWLAFGAFEGI
jgi:NAD(P)-dependent dehydrogenase (short-subunit alcohol dehydrogenase family)